MLLYLTIILVASARLHLGLVRYFDPDEFAHLHWAWLVASGYLPYRDFFFYITPGFAWLLSPILWLTGNSTQFLIAGRVFMFLVYGACAAIVYRLSRGSLLAVLIFLTFPMTIDKSLDVRPDMVMLILYFGSIMVKSSFFSGILFGVSFLVFPKIVFGLPALLYLKRPKPTWFAGAALVGIGFVAYLWVNHLIPRAITSMTRDSVAVTSGKFTFTPWSVLTPYPLIYVTDKGVSLPWAVNTVVWILGAVGLAIMIRTNRRMGLFWSLFIGGNILFVMLFPAPYVQYFLPLSLAASVLVGFTLTKSITMIKVITIITVISSFFLQYRERVAPGADNGEQLGVIRDIVTITKPNETIYDMVGSYVFRPDGYFICCHPYGEFASKLSDPPESLSESLIANKTKFLVMDRVGFVFWQSPEPDLTFLLTHYLPTKYKKIYSLGFQFRCGRGACVQYNLHNKVASNKSTTTVSVPVAEMYSVAIEPSDETVTLNNRMVNNGDSIPLTADAYSFTVSPRVSSFRIQLAR